MKMVNNYAEYIIYQVILKLSMITLIITSIKIC